MARKRPEPKKDFIAYKNGSHFKIVPRSPRGRKYLALWLLILLAPILPFALFAAAVDDTPYEYWVLWMLIPLFLYMALLTWRMAKWMLARAEVITIDDIVQWKRDKARKGER